MHLRETTNGRVFLLDFVQYVHQMILPLFNDVKTPTPPIPHIQ